MPRCVWGTRLWRQQQGFLSTSQSRHWLPSSQHHLTCVHVFLTSSCWRVLIVRLHCGCRLLLPLLLLLVLSGCTIAAGGSAPSNLPPELCCN